MKEIYFVNNELIVGCTSCGYAEVIPCTAEQYDRYMSREECVQDIFPELSADDREILAGTGWCKVCWKLKMESIPAKKEKKLIDNIVALLKEKGYEPDDVDDLPKDAEGLADIISGLLWADDDETAEKVRSMILEAYNDNKKE